MLVIHKFRIHDPSRTNIVKMDWRGTPVRVAFQASVLQMWAEVDPNAPQADRVFHVYATGEPIQEDDQYIGTATREDEFGFEFVWHVYERMS